MTTTTTSTATTKKMTKRDYFSAILAKYPLTEEEKAFVEHEIELLSKKNASEKKPTAQQAENEGIKEAILNGLGDHEMMTISEMQKKIPGLAELSNQRISALVRQLIAENVLVRTEDKRKAYFSKV